MRSDAELLAPKLGQPPEKHAQRRSLSARFFLREVSGVSAPLWGSQRVQGFAFGGYDGSRVLCAG